MNAAELDALVTDPGWLLHQLDVIGDRALFYRATPAVYRGSLFLDERIALREPAQQIVPVPELTARLTGARPRADFIFHVGHCGSTLLSRLLETAAGLLALREPVPLRALAAFLRDRAHPLGLVAPEDYPALERTVIALLARRFEADKTTLIKATSDCGVLAERTLEMNPDNRAVCLYLELDEFLATMLRSELRRQETAHFAQSRLADLHLLLGSDEIRIYRLSAGELCAMSWASNLLTLARLKERCAGRVLWLDFIALLDDFRAGLTRAAEFLGLDIAPGALEGALDSGLLSGYSKDPDLRYDRSARDAELADCRRRFAAEIAAGKRWIERLIDGQAAAAPLRDHAG